MIIYACSDLIFATKIRSTAESLGVVTRPVRDIPMLQARLNQVDDDKPNDEVTALMVDLDTGDAGLRLIEQTKASHRTISVIAFGSHVEVEALESAKQAGADHVYTRGSFTSKLPQLLQEHASRV